VSWLENNKKIVELYEKREKLEGTRVLRMQQNLADSLYAVDRNRQELLKMVGVYERNFLSLWDVANRPKLAKFLRELKRLLHNYLSSIFSLIEHTRAFCEDLGNSKFESAYRTELQKLKTNKCVIFLPSLRTYAQHKELPFVVAKLSGTKQNIKNDLVLKHSLVLRKEDLLRWDSWDKDSRSYISHFEDDIELKTVVNEYHDLIWKFYKWIYAEVDRLYSKELKELDQIKSQMRRLVPPV